MKTVILAGGFGTRLSEETHLKPKPMIEIDGKPLLWHIMKRYSMYGFNEFIICCGYKGYIIKEYFANYYLHSSNVTIDLKSNSLSFHKSEAEPWTITLVDTGLNSFTGGRLKAISPFLSDDQEFFMTYGDGLADVDINKLLESHKKSGCKATVTAVNPPGRFGTLVVDKNNLVSSFKEKPFDNDGRINGGYFVLNSSIFQLIDDSQTVWEKEPMENLANSLQLNSFNHDGFWQPCDTLRDKTYLESLAKSQSLPPWLIK